MRSTIVSLLIIATFTYLASSQATVTTCGTAQNGGSTCATAAGIVTVTSCSSNFVISGLVSTCTGASCGSGCQACINATYCVAVYPGYALYMNGSMANAVALGTGCMAGTALTNSTVNCTAAMPYYATFQGGVVPCNGTSSTTVNGTAIFQVPNCGACTVASAKVTGATNWYVTCSSCQMGFLFPAITQVNITGTTGISILYPECVSSTVVATATGLSGSGNVWGASTAYTTTVLNLMGYNTSTSYCQAGIAVSITTSATQASSIAGYQCTWSANNTWCPLVTGTTYLTAAALCGNAGNTPTAAISNCNGGLATGTTAATANCQWPSPGYNVSSNAVGNTVYQNAWNCLASVGSATNCTLAAPGSYIASNGTAMQCMNGTTQWCSGGLLSGQIQLVGYSVLNATSSQIVSGCLWYASAGQCAVCNGTATTVPTCLACPANCMNCTASGGNATCATCNSGYSVLSTGQCATACANGTNRSSNGSCTSAYGKNMIASAVAFASLVFYYIF